MRPAPRIIAVALATLHLIGPPSPGQDAPKAPPRPLILVHVMPWFEAKPTSAAWGWHWTMGHFDPDRIGTDGKRAVAAHLYPLTGPYDSADPALIEYQTLLMRVAGIDGVIADWYGSEDFNDYASIHRRTVALFEAAQRRGLKFAVCYEDRVLKALVDAQKSTPAQAVDHARTHLQFAARAWFADPAYLTWQGKPLLMVFGPDYLKPGQWETALAGLRPAPAFFTLHERRPPALGSFAWPPMWAAKDGVLAPADLDAYLDRFARQDGARIPAAFPGFHDIYREAGVRPSYGFLADRAGATLRETLQRALAAGQPLVQVATWNDFGEGTAIEPTRERGYRDLVTVQEARRQLAGPPFPFRPADLPVPLRIFQLRKRADLSAAERRTLDEAASLLAGGKVPPAVDRIERLEQAPARPR